MKVGDLVKLTWEITDVHGAPNVGIITDIEELYSESGRKDVAVTAVFGNWQTTQLEEYFEIIHAPTR